MEAGEALKEATGAGPNIYSTVSNIHFNPIFYLNVTTVYVSIMWSCNMSIISLKYHVIVT